MAKFKRNYSETVANESIKMMLDRLGDGFEVENDEDVYDYLWNEVNDEFIYTEDQWTVIQDYYNPTDDDIALIDAFGSLISDLQDYFDEITENKKEEK